MKKVTTHEGSRGVCCADPLPIVCAKDDMLGAFRVCALDNPGAPPMGIPKFQLDPLPRTNALSQVPEETVMFCHSNRTHLAVLESARVHRPRSVCCLL